MKRRILITRTASTVILVGLLITGFVYFLQRPDPKTSNASTGNVHLTDYTDNDSAQSTVVISGKIGDFGRAERSSARSKSIMTLYLSHGTFQLDVTNLSKHFTAAVGKVAFNQETCSGNLSVTSPVPIVAGSGTATYAGIKGSFDLTMSLDEVVPQQQHCSASSKMVSQVIVSSGWGNISFK